ncbi:hypothetical protein D3C86_1898530 [compost metagenome]
MGRYVIGGHFAEKHLPERLRCQFRAGARNGFGHRRMNARETELESPRKEGRQVAETYDPFRVFEELVKIEPIHDPGTAVAPAGRDNGLNGRIIEHLLHIRQPVVIGSRKLVK